MLHRSFQYKLEPTPYQEELFAQFAGTCRAIYNAALEQRRDWWRQYRANTGRSISYFSQDAELTELRSQVDWIRDVTRTCQQQALRDLDKAFTAFFKGASGFPRPRRKGERDGFRFRGREVAIRKLNAKWSTVWLPKIGWVKFRDTRPHAGEVRTAAVVSGATGWSLVLACAIDVAPAPSTLPSVGIDRGIATSLTLSDGASFNLPAPVSDIDKRCRLAQKRVSRRVKGSKRRIYAIKRAARLAARRGRMRKDWHHKTALAICQKYGAVVVEALKIGNMTASAKGTIESPGRNVRQKAGLNRSILNQGWAAFATILGYKLEERGGALVTVDPAFTSQTCSACGVVDKRSRKSQAVFACVECNFTAHADHNAAINILRRSTSSMRMEEGHGLSDEVRTRSGIAAENLAA